MDKYLDRQYLETELYEKTLVRERRKKSILISLSLLLFLFLCGIPVYNERLPKWMSLQAARKIAIEIEQMKTEALHLKKPLQLSIQDNGQLRIELVSHCRTSASDSNSVQELIRENKWTDSIDEISVMGDDDAKKFKMNFVVQQICFDPVLGLLSPNHKKVLVLAPVKDLAESRLDRASYVEVEASSARISIN